MRVWWIAAWALTGCSNPCQSLCVRMADYAAECGYSVSDADIDACVADNASPDDPAVCRDFGNAEQIRDEWTCDDLAIYFE
jgi:hypothetical protein